MKAIWFRVLMGAAVSMGFSSAQAQEAKPLGAAAKVRLDVGKGKIEQPTELLLARAASAGFVNPKVEPGKVRWHVDFDAARAASAKSGKPVLLFQMMGKLDEQFC